MVVFFSSIRTAPIRVGFSGQVFAFEYKKRLFDLSFYLYRPILACEGATSSEEQCMH